MAKLIYSMITSLDGYAEAAEGVRLELEMVEERAFDSGLIHARYRTR